MPDTSNSARDTTPRQRGRYMMEESNETKDDIIAEMKRRKENLEDAVFAAPLCYSTETMQAQSEILDEFIERFEAAHEREKATAEKSSAVGDAAKLREALEFCVKGMCGFCRMDAEARGMTTECVNGCEALRKAKAALAAPPRNCDIHTDFNDAIMTLANKRNWHDGKWNSERYCILASWLLAPATEKEGGNNAD